MAESDVKRITESLTTRAMNNSALRKFSLLPDEFHKNVTTLVERQEQKIKNKESDLARFKGQYIFADFRKFYNVSSEYLQNPLIHRHQFKLSMNYLKICEKKQIFVLFAIHSCPIHFKDRQSIRSTWASVNRLYDKQIEHVFLVGQTTNHTLNTQLQIESDKYNDMIQGNFIDSYRNMTYKHVLVLYWIKRYCNHAKFVVKLDDDVMVNMPLLIRFLQNKTDSNITSNMLHCKFCLSDGPERSLENKWYTTVGEYPYIKFPPYCQGLAYIVTLDVVIKFLEATKSIPFLWIDDVYVAGFLPWVTGVVMTRPAIFSDYIHSRVISNTTSLFYLFDKRFLNQKMWRSQWIEIIKKA